MAEVEAKNHCCPTCGKSSEQDYDLVLALLDSTNDMTISEMSRGWSVYKILGHGPKFVGFSTDKNEAIRLAAFQLYIL